MTTEVKSIKTVSLPYRLFKWALLVLFLCGIPTFMAMFAVYRYYLVLEHEKTVELKTDLPVIAGEAETFLDQDLDFNALQTKIEESAKKIKGLRVGLYYVPTGFISPKWRQQQSGLQGVLKKCENEGLRFYEFKNSYLVFQYLTDELRIFGVFKRLHTVEQIMLRAALGGVIWLLLMLPFNIYLIKTVVLQKPASVSIKTKLSFLFLLACGIPITAMAIISHEYGLQKHRQMKKEAFGRCIEVLSDFDQGFTRFLDKYAKQLSDYFNQWQTGIGAHLTPQNAVETINTIKNYGSRSFSIVPFSGRKAIFPFGLAAFKGKLANLHFDDANSYCIHRYRNMKSDSEMSYLVSRKLLSDVNSVELPDDVNTRFELAAQAFVHKSMLEFINSVLNNLDRINKWKTFNTDYSFAKLLHGSDKNKAECLVSLFWNANDLQRRYVLNSITEANKNPDRIRVYCANVQTGEEWPQIADSEAELKSFVRRKTPKLCDEIEQVRLNNEDYIAVGLLGQSLYTYQITCLYPVEPINKEIAWLQAELILFMIFCLLFSVSLANMLARGFLVPMRQLLEGALAIENRDVSHRVSYNKKDELGQAAAAFNRVMVGLEELQTAQIVQESLFPKSLFNKGRFEIYGKSIALGELGGDYFDYFEIDESHFAVLAGDVSGHGIGAAVIMAMAKAGILASANLQKMPAALLASLHKMILGAKGKRQKKFMTFQYMYVNSETGNAVYSNAGACSLMIVRGRGQSVEEVLAKGGVLGGFRRAQFFDKPLVLNEYDTAVFYTDGVIEAKNKDGQMIGYESFKQMLLKNYSPDPEVFYNNVYEDFKTIVRSAKTQEDDLTMVFMACKPACYTGADEEIKALAK